MKKVIPSPQKRGVTFFILKAAVLTGKKKKADHSDR
jgi:hypothetical protein